MTCSESLPNFSWTWMDSLLRFRGPDLSQDFTSVETSLDPHDLTYLNSSESTHSINSTPRPDPGQLHCRIQVEGDAHPAEVRRALLHRQAGTQVRLISENVIWVMTWCWWFESNNQSYQGWQRERRGPGRHCRLLFAQGRAHHVARGEGRWVSESISWPSEKKPNGITSFLVTNLGIDFVPTVSV